MEWQPYNVATFGLTHESTLSTDILIRIVQALVCRDFFSYSSRDTPFHLELHLRCVVASLRLLSAHGIRSGSGALRFPIFENLYKAIPKWQEYNKGQTQNISRVEDKLMNHNNEFLIVYAKNLISSTPSDRTTAANITTRVVAVAAALGYAVRASRIPCSYLALQGCRESRKFVQNCGRV